jgi:hypothetical protein
VCLLDGGCAVVSNHELLEINTIGFCQITGDFQHV